MLNGLFWALFGLVIGWIAAILQGAQTTARTLRLIIIGGAGGIVGGLGGLLLDARSVGYQSVVADVMFAIFGACVFAFVAGVVANKTPE